MNSRRYDIEKIQRGYTQKQLAELLGVKQPHLSAWLNGRHLPRYETVCKLAQILNCNEEELDTYFQRVYQQKRNVSIKEKLIENVTQQLKSAEIPFNSKVIVQVVSDESTTQFTSEISE